MIAARVSASAPDRTSPVSSRWCAYAEPAVWAGSVRLMLDGVAETGAAALLEPYLTRTVGLL
ncbi:hypothetical protein QQM39_01785 [Streptomyces sp. DT2A-34]|uniref:hypothetical protein n=1 Tax=Streptomyces sp. DT2A-34 TaxID=3051182 RepID=UPI00265C6CE1|nr:hypothetical protein [Streptomyces sp. DT2A-34]MDO0909633.1 hypothetical protein [Streptomyces sp. DT2A-34]